MAQASRQCRMRCSSSPSLRRGLCTQRRGWGGVLRRVSLRGEEEEEAALRLAGVWVDGATTHSVHTELEGLWRALAALGRTAEGQVILHRTDSTSTFDLLRRGGARGSPVLTHLVRRIWLYCAVKGIHLASDYVGAGVIIRSGADALSRREDHSECCLGDLQFALLWRHWGPFAVDMFATFASVRWCVDARVPLPYWSLWVDAHTRGVDSLTADWAQQGGVCYAFPPVHLVGKVLQVLASQAAADAVLVAPRWPSQWWWPLLGRLTRGEICTLGPGVCVAARAGGPTHPFGPKFQHPERVVWVAARIRARGGSGAGR